MRRLRRSNGAVRIRGVQLVLDCGWSGGADRGVHLAPIAGSPDSARKSSDGGPVESLESVRPEREASMVEVDNISDWQGKELIDRDGERIGKLEDVYVDTASDQPIFVTVKEGFVSKHLTFVPLDGAAASPDGLQVAVSKAEIKDAPNIDQGAELSQDQEAAVYGHYGVIYSPADNPSGRRLAKR
jgi:PRC-barrel domain